MNIRFKFFSPAGRLEKKRYSQKLERQQYRQKLCMFIVEWKFVIDRQKNFSSPGGSNKVLERSVLYFGIKCTACTISCC